MIKVGVIGRFAIQEEISRQSFCHYFHLLLSHIKNSWSSMLLLTVSICAWANPAACSGSLQDHGRYAVNVARAEDLDEGIPPRTA